MASVVGAQQKRSMKRQTKRPSESRLQNIVQVLSRH
eukprot:CAMPEP_0198367980 /NCGR_PEP_ID=MMETSP1450-20131203/155465_1 /TAXON_ID=753684 ORGANISM="Madagascaria erythrocladiodes, Strain CCMP3234" /NCGR_SAMPLE_ID=MMETSP1450 /ASSEMBLY_ACC=CAM_ASM_001115 /LENGTH=35 /DNA_ID= /DNA_START= /DNA_END= /DNA_ORIENTATION=